MTRRVVTGDVDQRQNVASWEPVNFLGQFTFDPGNARPPDELAVRPESLPWRRGIFLRGPERLPLRVRTEARAAA